MNGWTRVEDGLPEEGSAVYVSALGLTSDMGYYGEGRFWFYDGATVHRAHNVTHWRYADVPEPPALDTTAHME